MIIGSGGREHALSTAYEKSSRIQKIIVTPGNDFMKWNRKKEIVIEKESKLNDAESLLRIAQKHRPDIIDVAQDDALAAGTVDLLQKNGFMAFGPTRNAARLEWDKRWSREFMTRNRIPTPEYRYFDSIEKGKEYATQLYQQNPNQLLFVKATGLCAGKGALKTTSVNQAHTNIEFMKNFGEAGKEFLIEEGLIGEEYSHYAISDGKTHQIVSSAQDHKTANNFDEGNQTGGMGTVSPVQITKGYEEEIENQQIKPVTEGMKKEGNPYRGIIYVGGIVTQSGISTIEYNSRWGDPECQVVLPKIQNDYAELILKCMEGKLENAELKLDDVHRVCVVGASRGYPGDYSLAKGKQIFGLDEANEMKNVTIYGAGISIKEEKFFANGGRLFNIVGAGKNVQEARQNAYAAISLIHIEGNNLHYRTDIGWRDLNRVKK